MVYESDFTRRQFLNSCTQSGMFYSSPEYKPSNSLNFRSSTTAAPTSRAASSSIPATGSRSERTARLLASLSSNLPTQLPSPQFRRSFDPEHPYTSSESDGASDHLDYVSQRNPRIHTGGNGHERSCCACCKNCGGGRSEPRSFHPTGAGDNLKTQDGMESYIKSRRPYYGDDDETFQLKTKPTYSVRSIPVRSLDELRETVAIRRNYIKERNQLGDESTNNGTLAIPFQQPRENSVSPQPDGSIVIYPSENCEEIKSSNMNGEGGGGSYHVVDEV